MVEKVYATPNAPTPGMPVVFDNITCNGCNRCVNICQTDIFMPNPVEGEPPLILFPDECWYCGCCVEICPSPEAITLRHPLMQRVRWKRKETGEHFRV